MYVVLSIRGKKLHPQYIEGNVVLCVMYWTASPVDIELKQHGNAKKHNHLYVRTTESVHAAMKNELLLHKPSKVSCLER